MGQVMDKAGIEDTGLEVINLSTEPAFARRRLHTRDISRQMEGMNRLAQAFVASPDTILQELVNAAVDLCGADSAGISLEQPANDDASYYEWVATAGQYAGFLHASLPRNPSACGICLERGEAQLFRVTQRFFDLMGVTAPSVTDGILLPWQVGDVRGTIWIMAHTSDEAFDGEDLHMMQVLANFAAMGVRQQQQGKLLMEQTRVAAAAAMANQLAHEINNPLQSLTNILYLAGDGEWKGNARALVEELSDHVRRLSVLTAKLLALPTACSPLTDSQPPISAAHG